MKQDNEIKNDLGEHCAYPTLNLETNLMLNENAVCGISAVGEGTVVLLTDDHFADAAG